MKKDHIWLVILLLIAGVYVWQNYYNTGSILPNSQKTTP